METTGSIYFGLLGAPDIDTLEPLGGSGVSCGELAALCAAGCFDFADRSRDRLRLFFGRS